MSGQIWRKSTANVFADSSEEFAFYMCFLKIILFDFAFFFK